MIEFGHCVKYLELSSRINLILSKALLSWCIMKHQLIVSRFKWTCCKKGSRHSYIGFVFSFYNLVCCRRQQCCNSWAGRIWTNHICEQRREQWNVSDTLNCFNITWWQVDLIVGRNLLIDWSVNIVWMMFQLRL